MTRAVEAPPSALTMETAELRRRMVAAQIEANWPTDTDDSVCRYCGKRDENLIPIGYGSRPRVWVHRECWEPWREALHREAAVALGFYDDEW